VQDTRTWLASSPSEMGATGVLKGQHGRMFVKSLSGYHVDDSLGHNQARAKLGGHCSNPGEVTVILTRRWQG
jgi:hypothetical protein